MCMNKHIFKPFLQRKSKFGFIRHVAGCLSELVCVCESKYLSSQNDLSVSRHKEGAKGIFTGHGANHLQS